jgi:hypothetical protein
VALAQLLEAPDRPRRRGGLVGFPLVVFAFLSGLTGGTAEAPRAIALMFLVLGASLYRLGHALERLLDEEPKLET